MNKIPEINNSWYDLMFNRLKEEKLFTQNISLEDLMSLSKLLPTEVKFLLKKKFLLIKEINIQFSYTLFTKIMNYCKLEKDFFDSYINIGKHLYMNTCEFFSTQSNTLQQDKNELFNFYICLQGLYSDMTILMIDFQENLNYNKEQINIEKYIELKHKEIHSQRNTKQYKNPNMTLEALEISFKFLSTTVSLLFTQKLKLIQEINLQYNPQLFAKIKTYVEQEQEFFDFHLPQWKYLYASSLLSDIYNCNSDMQNFYIYLQGLYVDITFLMFDIKNIHQ